MKSTTSVAILKQALPRDKKKKQFKISLIFEITALITILILLVSSISIYIIYNLSYSALKTQIENQLTMIASNTTVAIDIEKLKTIRTEEDEGNKVYMELQKKLQDVKEASSGKLRYVYTIARIGNKCVYILDAAPIEDTENHSTVGSEFSLEDYPEASKGFMEPTAEKKLSYDKEFNIWSQSGYAPIKDNNGKVVGVVGIDMDVTTLKDEEAQMKQAGIIALGISLLLALILGIMFSKYLTEPIIILTKGTKSIAEGDLDISVNVKRNDEFGELASSFNSMTKDLKDSHEALKKYSLELEEKVAQRTAELSEINKEIKDILDNMSQAIFTIDSGLNFNSQHSRFAYNIFGDIEFAEKSILDVLFSDEEQTNNRKNMLAWLNKVFENSYVRWEDMEALQPVREVSIKTNSSNEKNGPKYIKIDFQPITDIFAPEYKEKVTKVMVIVQDVTEKKILELEMEKKEKEYKDNINQIIEVIKMDEELFQDYINECKENLANFEPKLIALKDDKHNMEIIDELFRIMHTIKGNAKIFKLERISGEAHSIESIFSEIRKGQREMDDELLNETFKKLDHFNSLFNESLEIYNKITAGKNADLGRVHSIEQEKEDSEVIKVKVQEISRLTELIKKADRLLSEDSSKVEGKKERMEKVKAIEDIFKETEEQLKAMSKVSISRLFVRFPRMVRDISMELGKKARLIIKGDNFEIDKNIYEKISDPLVHILRNSIDHGLEIPQERIQLGKPEEGTVELSTKLTDSELQLEIIDDGQGLDIDKIKAKAVKNGLIPPEEALNMKNDEAINLIFLPGFSTNERVTNISGRGVGMDVVKTSIEESLKGSIVLESKKNQGLKITLKIPLVNAL